LNFQTLPFGKKNKEGERMRGLREMRGKKRGKRKKSKEKK
jgi:hypothetical protein